MLASSEFATAFVAICVAVIVLLAISAATIVFGAIFALVIASLLIVTLSHVPQISPANCILPALVVVAFGTVALDPIDIHAVPLHM